MEIRRGFKRDGSAKSSSNANEAVQLLEEWMEFLQEGPAPRFFSLWNQKARFESPDFSFSGTGITLPTVLHQFREWTRVKGKGIRLTNRVVSSCHTIAAEAELILEGYPYPTLPLAFALSTEKGKINRLHVYHSHWALEDHHRIRKPLFSPTQTAPLAPVIQAYHSALTTGSTQHVLSLFEPGAIAREPSGDAHTVADFFPPLFRHGGVQLVYHSFFRDKEHLAAEYTCTHWGQQAIPPQAGMEFWDFGKDDKLRVVRIYDDIEQP